MTGHGDPATAGHVPSGPCKQTGQTPAELTAVSRGVAAAFGITFGALITLVPVLQVAFEWYGSTTRRGDVRGWRVSSWIERCPSMDVRGLRPSRAEVAAVLRSPGIRGRFRALKAVNGRLLQDIQAYESRLKDESFLVRYAAPWVGWAITGWLRGGTEQAYCGRNGWLFFRPDVDAVTGAGFLDRAVLQRRQGSASAGGEVIEPDPLKAMVEFRDQLAQRGVELVLLPVPVKPSIYPERFSRRQLASLPVENRSYRDWLQRLRKAGVKVFDPSEVLVRTKREVSGRVYLATDTHWTPDGMERTAQALAEFLRQTVPLREVSSPPCYELREQQVTNHGDIVRLLALPVGQRLYPPETVQIRQVLEGIHLWRPDRHADVLLLGDSFANVFSLDAMGWGEAAGLAEHLSYALRRPVDVIARNDAGAWATREQLSRELRKGSDRLAGKRVVIWQFAARELVFGDWRRIPLKLGTPEPSEFFAPPQGASMVVLGTVQAAARAPRPGSVPYRDHIVMVHLVDLESEDPGVRGRQAAVLMWSMRNNVWTPAARYRPGQKVRVRLRSWEDVAPTLDGINRAELDEEALLYAAPCWGEEISGIGEGRP